MPDADRGDIADQHGNIVVLRDNVLAMSLIERTSPTPRTTARLRTDSEYLAADIDVAVVQRLQDLGQCQAIALQLGEIDRDIISLGPAAPASDVDDTWHGPEAPLDHQS